jgi:DNA-binding response OmpR family regulator
MKSNTKSLIVVDDDPDTRESVSVALRAEGFDVREAADRNAALEMIKEDPADAIFIDWQMPGLGIQEFLVAVRAITPSTMVILMTARDRVQHKADELGVRSYLAKPFELQALVRSVSAWSESADNEVG